MCKNMQIHCNNHDLWRFCSLRAQTEKVSKNKLRPKSILKYMQNRCENNAQTSDAKIMESLPNMDPQKLPNQ